MAEVIWWVNGPSFLPAEENGYLFLWNSKVIGLGLSKCSLLVKFKLISLLFLFFLIFCFVFIDPPHIVNNHEGINKKTQYQIGKPFKYVSKTLEKSNRGCFPPSTVGGNLWYFVLFNDEGCLCRDLYNALVHELKILKEVIRPELSQVTLNWLKDIHCRRNSLKAEQ